MSQDQSKQSTQKNKGWLNAAVIGVIIFLTSVGGVFYLWVDSQTHYLTERNFRLLGLHGSLLNKKLAIQEKVFKNTITPVLKSEQFSKSKKAITENKSVECRDSKLASDLKENQDVESIYEKLCKPYQQSRIELDIPNQNIDFSQNNYKFFVNSEAQGSNSQIKLGFHQDKEKSGGIDVFFPVDVLMKQLELGVEKHIFDDLLLADEVGQILYQKNSSVFQYDSVVSLLLGRDPETFFKKSKDEESSKDTRCKEKNFLCSLPLSRDIEVANLHYKVFAQAVTFPGMQRYVKNNVESDSAAKNQSEQSSHSSKAILIGLIETEKFHSQAYAISPVYLVFFLFLGMALVFGLPFLKLWTMGPQDRLTIVDVLSLFFSCLIGTGLLVFFLLYSYVSWTEPDSLSTQLNTIANDIDKTFQAELGAVLEQVKNLPIGGDLKKLRDDKIYQEKRTEILNILSEKNKPESKKDNRLFTFPFFHQVAWIAGDGKQKIKWSTTDNVTELVSVSSRPYFLRVQKANRLKEPELFLMKYVSEEEGKAPKYFWLEPILSMTNGNFTTVLSMFLGSNEKDEKEFPVVSITPDLISLREVRLPQGFGFAVVARGHGQDFPLGQVLFHSEEKRNLRENFLKVTDENIRLQSLIRLGHAGEVKGRYWGEAHTFYARPLGSTPWELVVFVNNGVLWTPVHQALMLALVLFGIYAFFVIVAFFLGILVFRSIWNGSGIWLWPQPSLVRFYQIASVGNLLISILFGVMLWSATHEEAWGHSWFNADGAWGHSLFTAAAIFPILGIILLVFFVRKNNLIEEGKKDQKQSDDQQHERNAGRRDPKPSDKWDYLHLLMSLLILLSIMPAFGFFNVAHDVGVSKFQGNLQSYYQDVITERAKAIVNKYHDVPNLVSTESDSENFVKEVMRRSRVSFSQQVDKKSIWSCAYLPSEFHQSNDFPNWYIWLTTTLALSSMADQVVVGTKPIKSIEEVKRLCPDPQYEPWEKAGFIEDPISLNWEFYGSYLVPIVGLVTFMVLRWFRFSLCSIIRGRIVKVLQIAVPWIMGFLFMFVFWLIVLDPKFFEQFMIRYSLWTLLFFALIAVLFLLPRFVVRRVFFLDVETPLRWGNDNLSYLLQNTAQLEFPGLLIVGPPGSGKSTAFRKASGKKFYPMDLRDLLRHSQEIFSKMVSDAVNQPQGTVIMLDHFEYARGIQEYDKQKLELLEELLRRDRRVCVISDIHPLDKEYFLDSIEEESSEATNQNQRFINRWRQAFQMFVTLPFSGPSTEGDSSARIDAFTHLKKYEVLWKSTRNDGSNDSGIVSSEGQVEGVRSLARSYYQSLWASCTDDEKLSLYHLAVDRFLHSNNPNFRGLYEKGLIEIRPHLQLMDESFRQFVLTVGEEENIAQLGRSGLGSMWKMIHRPLIVGLVVIGVFLVTTQESIKSEFLAFVSLIPVALPTLMKFFSIFRHSKSSN